MKILLMRPQSNLKKMIPMGIMYIAGYVRKAIPNVEIEIFDLRQNNSSEEEIKQKVNKISPDIVGISAVNIESKLTHSLIKIVKEVNRNTKVIIGGPYATSLPHIATKDSNVFCCVIGEGEETMVELLTKIHTQSKLSDAKGIAYNDNGKLIRNPPREFILNLDSIPTPAYDLINIKDYFRSFGTHAGFQAHPEYASIFSSRGCPFRCVYCHDIFGKKIRYRSAENVFEEMVLLQDRYGVKEIHIEDDSFNIDKERVRKIFNLIIENKIEIKIAFPNGIRADLVDDEILNLFKKAGVYRLAYGIESGSSKIQKKIQKTLNLELAKKNIALTAQKGISTHGFFMMGFLGETKEEINQTIDYALKSKLHTASFSFVVPQPGTKLYEEAINAGYNFDNMDAEQLNPGMTEINISAVSVKELHKLHRKAYKEFYMNLNRILRIYLTTPQKLFLLKSFLVFLTHIAPIPIKIRAKLQGMLYK